MAELLKARNDKWHSPKHDFRRIFDFSKYGVGCKRTSVRLPPHISKARDLLVTSIRGTFIPFTLSVQDGKAWLGLTFPNKPLRYIYLYYNQSEL